MIQRCITVNTTSFVGSILLSLSRQREGNSPRERVFLVSKVTFSGGE